MKQMKKIWMGILVLCMVFSLCACGGTGSTGKENPDGNEEDSQGEDDASDKNADDEDQEATGFLVKVVDEGGNPVAGIMVQLCKDSCIPKTTDDSGEALFSVEDTEGYKLSVMSCPDGYEYSGEEEIHLDGGEEEYTLTVQAVK